MSAARRIVVLTGAGISAESGIATFRDKGGIWENNRIEDVATPEAFRRDPKRVHEFYNARRAALTAGNIRPNAAHGALARLEAAWPGSVLVVTQNIDDLHEQGGTRNLIHMHGELRKARCEACATVVQWDGALSMASVCPNCTTAGGMRPHVVWFGEMPLQMERIQQALSRCDLFISIGTSGNVYPAAGFVEEARTAQAYTVELNLEPSTGETSFAERRYGPATEIVTAYVEELLAEA